MEINWFDYNDKSKSVFDAKEHAKSEHRKPIININFPNKAVLFCMGKAMGIIKNNFETETIINELPGFITKPEIIKIKHFENVCFLHGGYAAPQTADVVETLNALGVKELILFGMIGGFGENLKIGDVIFPNKILAEDGVSLHYGLTNEFINNNCPEQFNDLFEYLKNKGHNCLTKDIVTSVAVFRQTFKKEEYWRSKGCVGVEMEAAGFLSACHFLKLPCYCVFFVSDKHPLNENDKWEWRTTEFTKVQTKFVCDVVNYFLK